jgi:hypothetical protein
MSRRHNGGNGSGGLHESRDELSSSLSAPLKTIAVIAKRGSVEGAYKPDHELRL